jgi:hypothetical protein
VWSDGGPKHFKTCNSLQFVLCQLKKQFDLKRLTWNFFGSHHGKGACDGHVAYAKSTLKRLALSGDVVDGAGAIAEVVNKLNETTAIHFEYFSREEAFNVDKIGGHVRRWHFFEWCDDVAGDLYTIQARELTCDILAPSGTLVVRTCFEMDIEQLGASLDARERPRKKKKGGSGPVRQYTTRTERVAMFKTVGTKVAVGYEAPGKKYRDYWYGDVVGFQVSPSGKDLIDVAFEAFGNVPATRELVELDHWVRLALDPLVTAK